MDAAVFKSLFEICCMFASGSEGDVASMIRYQKEGQISFSRCCTKGECDDEGEAED